MCYHLRWRTLAYGVSSCSVVANHLNGSVTVFPSEDLREGRLSLPPRLAPAARPRARARARARAPRASAEIPRDEHIGSGPGPTQQGPHAHHVAFDPAGQRVLLTDKGIDQVVIYRLDLASGELVPNDPPFGRIHAGAAPRHLAFGRDGTFVYVNGEADMTVSTCTYDSTTGALTEVQVVSTLPDEVDGEGFSSAEIAVDATGRFVYVSNRGHHSIATFDIDQSTGRLAPAGHVSTGGQTPRHFAIHPSGARVYVANQDSDLDRSVRRRSAPRAPSTPSGDVTKAGAPVRIMVS